MPFQPRTDQFDWTDEREDTLRALWTEGIPAAEIGQRFGCSKNAVIGKARRLRLQFHPNTSLIKYADDELIAVRALRSQGIGRKEIERRYDFPTSFWDHAYYKRIGKL